MAHEEYDYSSHENQCIVNIGIEKEIKTSYIEYAMSVIVGRALPDVRDGLKPVHRRILYSMYEEHLTYDKPFRKYISFYILSYILQIVKKRLQDFSDPFFEKRIYFSEKMIYNLIKDFFEVCYETRALRHNEKR